MRLCYTNIHTLIKACKTWLDAQNSIPDQGEDPSGPSLLTQSQRGFSHMCLDTSIFTPQI